jgi:2-polyprenyl-6-methoxyphenol hydroxylase-like FAD-dependent oxidoreductase
MKILIVGAGIAGLSLAAHLQQQEHNVTIIERDTVWDRRGYAISLHHNGLKTLEKFSIIAELLKNSSVYTKSRVRDNNGKILKEVDYSRLSHQYGPSIIILRKKVHSALLSLHKNSKIRMGTTVTDVREHEDDVFVTFSDGTQGSFDLVVGADGVGSQIRERFFTKNARKFIGGEYWTAIIPSLPSYTIACSEMMVHKDKSFLAYHFDNSSQVCVSFGIVVNKKIKSRISNLEELRKNFSDCKYFIPEILQKLPSYQEMYHGFISEVTLEKWYTRRIVLIGDAAHAMNPIVGLGTSLTLEDAYVLAEELSKVTKETVTFAFEKYNRRRKKRVKRIQREGQYLAIFVRLGSPFNILRNKLIQLLLPSQFVNKLERTFAEQI